MAQKKPTTPFPFEQHSSSSDDQEEVSNEEGEEEVDEEEVSNEVVEEEVSEESESEEEEPKKPDPKPDSSSEEDGSDSGSDEEEVTPVTPVKPVVVQSPKVVRAKSTQKQQPATAPASAVTVPKLGKKRPVESKANEEATPVAPVKPVEVQSPKVGAKSTQKKQPDLAPASAVTVPKLGKKRPGESKADGNDSKKLKKVEDKRPVESKADGNDSKKKKLKKVEDKRVAEEEVKKVGDDPKKPLFQRLFSEEDETEMLKALLEYSSKKCIDPIQDFTDFHDFVKKCIHADVTRAQLSYKIWKMKRKYETNASKTKEGVDKTFGKPHDQSCYDLSKKIWGKSSSACVGSELKANGKGKRIPKPNMTSGIQIPQVVEEPVRENSSSLFCLSELAKTKDVVGMMGFSDDIFKKGFELLSDEARAALEDKWKNMVTAELELYSKRLELSGEQMKLSLDALGHRG